MCICDFGFCHIFRSHHRRMFNISYCRMCRYHKMYMVTHTHTHTHTHTLKYLSVFTCRSNFFTWHIYELLCSFINVDYEKKKKQQTEIIEEGGISFIRKFKLIANHGNNHTVKYKINS